MPKHLHFTGSLKLLLLLTPFLLLSPQFTNAQTYCIPYYQWGCIGIAITNFSVGTINHSGIYCTTSTPSSYNNFTTTHNTNLVAGNNYIWSVSTNYHSHNLAIWIDLNDDGDFHDPGELMYTTAALNEASGNFTLSPGAPLGTHRMRVRLKFHNPPFLASESCAQMNEGETRDYSVTIVAGDNTPPVISGMPSNTTANNSPGQCGAIVNWTAPTATDNVSVATFVSTHQSGNFFPVGTTTVTYTATDPSSNATTASFNITVTDTESPVILNVPSEVLADNATNQCEATVNWIVPSATDNCSVVSFTSSHNSGDVFQVGTTTVTYTAGDNEGNITTASFNVIVSDADVPVITGMPGNLTVNSSSPNCDAVANWVEPNATDNCAVAGITSSHSNGGIFPVGTTIVTYTATDLAGNMSTATFEVTVVDNEPPVFANCPTNKAICVGEYTFVAPTATDNCSAVVGQVAGPVSGQVLGAGTYTISYAATDPSNNMATCSYEVVVAPLPVVELAANTSMCINNDLVLDGGAGFASYQWTVSPAGTTYNSQTITLSGASLGIGTHTLELKLSDANGCENTGTMSIVVGLCTGTETMLSGSMEVNVYPNPASGNFNVSILSIEKMEGEMVLVNSNGQVVAEETILLTAGENNHNIKVPDNARGVYFLRIVTRNYIMNKKVVLN